MREQVIINVNGYKVKVDLIYSISNSRTYHYCFGIINVRVKQNYPLSKLTKDLEKVFPVSTLEKFNAEPLLMVITLIFLGKLKEYIQQKEIL